MFFDRSTGGVDRIIDGGYDLLQVLFFLFLCLIEYHNLFVIWYGEELKLQAKLALFIEGLNSYL